MLSEFVNKLVSILPAITWDLGISIASSAGGYAIRFVQEKIKVYRKDRPIEKVWRFLQDPTHIFLTLANVGKVGASGGYGDLLAMSYVYTLAEHHFSSAKLAIHTDHSSLSGVCGENLIVIGGGKYNTVYRKLIEDLHVPLHFFDTDTESFKDIRNRERAIVFSPEYGQNGKIVHDIGLAVIAKNPKNENKKIIIVAGAHTYGTAAAMKFLIDNVKLKEITRLLNKNVEIIIRCEIERHDITTVECILTKEF